MNKKVLIICISALCAMIALIAGAMVILYSGSSSGRSAAAGGDDATASAAASRPLLEAVPTDAAMVLYSSSFRDGIGMLGDSTLILGALSGGDSNEFKGFITAISKLSESSQMRSVRRSAMAISLHYSGSLTPLLILDVAKAGTDSTEAEILLEKKAAEMALSYSSPEISGNGESRLDGRRILLISPSQSLIQSAERHIAGHVSVTGSDGFASVASSLGGEVVIMFSGAGTSRLASSFLTREFARKAGFVKDFSKWTGLSVEKTEPFCATGIVSSDNGTKLLANMLSSLAPGESAVAEMLPSDVRFCCSVQIADVAAYIQSYRKYLDAAGRLAKYNSAGRTLTGVSSKALEQWAVSLDIKELSYAEFAAQGGDASVVMLRPGKPDCSLMFGADVFRNLKNGTGQIAASKYCRYPAAVFGDSFATADSSAVYYGGWLIFGFPEVLKSFTASASARTLSARLSDAGISQMSGRSGTVFQSYYSLSDNSAQLRKIFGKNVASAVETALEGISYSPVMLSIAPGGRLSLNVPRVQFSGSRDEVPALVRDTVVTVPTGPFKVKNSGTGRMNLFSQNANNYLVLKEEDGKGIWGVPFKTPICGAVTDIDYYANGKRQFLFASVSSLYLIDRLGRFVSPFPVDLGKEILLGPAVYDFTGAHGYTVMVLHKDNSIGMYDLHGKSPSSWKGIRPDNTVKSLPELLEAKGKKYWVVRTAVQTLVYPFEGGAPVTKQTGDKMIRPDSGITVRKDGSVSALCYDGKERTFKL